MNNPLALFALLLASPAHSDVGICPISADFVTEAETSETVEQIGNFQVHSATTRAFVDGAMVQIECTGIAPETVFPETSDAIILRDYARFWSILPTGPAYMEETPVKHYVLEGVKEIQGIEVTYTYRLFRFDDSFAMVATGVPSGKPTRDVLRFLSSIEITLSPSVDLAKIVRDGTIPDLHEALAQREWTETDLSAALVAAAGLDRPDAAKLLLDAGADPNFRVLLGSVLSVAVRENSVATLKTVLSSGGDPNQKTGWDWRPLHHAILPDDTKLAALLVLLAHGADVDARTNLQVTPLHRAAGFCDAEAVTALLKAGADPSVTEQYGRTAYQRSVRAGCPGIGGLNPTP